MRHQKLTLQQRTEREIEDSFYKEGYTLCFSYADKQGYTHDTSNGMHRDWSLRKTLSSTIGQNMERGIIATSWDVCETPNVCLTLSHPEERSLQIPEDAVHTDAQRTPHKIQTKTNANHNNLTSHFTQTNRVR